MLKRTPKPAKAAAAKAARKASLEAAPQEYRKPRADVYTVLLFVALAMLVVATVALWMTMKDFDYLIKGGPPNPISVWHRPAAGAALVAPRGIA